MMGMTCRGASSSAPIYKEGVVHWHPSSPPLFRPAKRETRRGKRDAGVDACGGMNPLRILLRGIPLYSPSERGRERVCCAGLRKRGRDLVSERLSDRVQDTFDVVGDFVVPEAEDSVTITG